MHFGLYLHRKGTITAEQLVSALDAQTRSLVRIGQIALEEGILSARNVFNILRAQHDSPHTRFGELAIELGLMTRNDLMRLLMIQSDRKIPIEEFLVRQGVLSQKQRDIELCMFRAIYARPNHVPPRSSSVRPPHARRMLTSVEETSLAT